VGKEKCLQNFGGRSQLERSLGRHRLKCVVILKWILNGIGCHGLDPGSGYE
jgi:hypothetical protein